MRRTTTPLQRQQNYLARIARANARFVRAWDTGASHVRLRKALCALESAVTAKYPSH